MRVLWERCKAIFRRKQLDREFDAETEFHIEEQADEYVRAGLPRAEALRIARRDFGGMTQIRETHSELRGFPLATSLLQDLRFGWRMLARDRGFAAVSLITMALAIGAGTAVFSVVSAVLLRPLPFADPSRLVAILSTKFPEGGHEYYSAPGVFLDWRDRARSFESLAGASHHSAIVSGLERPIVVSVTKATPDFLPLLGVDPVMGRLMKDGEPDTVLVSERFWRTALGTRPGVVGSSLIVGGRSLTVLGVVPAVPFDVRGDDTDLWTSFDGERRYRGGGSVICLAKLRAGVTRETAQAEMDSIMSQIRTEHQEDSKTAARVLPLRDWITGEARRPLVLLFAAVVLLVLISCSNMTNLLLARASAREHEMAIRSSLGAGHWRLARQTLVESLMLAGLGGAAGVLLAGILVHVAPSMESISIPRAQEIGVDGNMLGIACLLTIGCGLLFGLVPAWQAGRPAVAARAASRIRAALVAAQVSLALVLLSAAGLVTNSLIRLMRVDPGFDQEGLVTIQTRLPYDRYDSKTSVAFHEKLAEEVQRMPGVKSVTLSDYTPLQAVMYPFALRTDSRNVEAQARHVARGYFETVGVPLLAGRGFEAADAERTPIPVVISAETAKAFFDGESAIGRAIRTNYRSRPVLEVVGVAGDVRQLGLRRAPGMQIYFPLSAGAGYVVARVAPNTGPLGPAVSKASAALDPEVPAPEVSSIGAVIARETALPRFHAILFGSFAVLGLSLAVAGVYGVTSYAVARRTREFGVRLALGADHGSVLRMILGSGLGLTATGVAAGSLCAIAVTRLMRTLLFEVEPGDPATLAIAVVLLMAAALCACWIAARRVNRIDPNAALRCE